MPFPLVLVPCCSTKNVGSAVQPRSTILHERLGPLRDELREKVRATPQLAQDSANQTGWLAQSPQHYPARQLYCGPGYVPLTDLWDARGVKILIVSAAMGLVHPNETIPNYELTMADRIATGEVVYKFWISGKFVDIVKEVSLQLDVTHLWSLLPNSLPKFPYQQVLAPRWQNLPFVCRRVKVFTSSGNPAGSGSGVKRSEWLRIVVKTDPGLLTSDNIPGTFDSIPGFRFTYAP